MATDPFIKRLEARIQSQSDPLVQAECFAEMACYWARTGEFEKAGNICRQLRAAYGDGRSPRVSTLIMCIEGLLLFFKDVSMASLDRLARANILSRSFGLDDIAAFSSAWISHICFNADRFEDMCVAIRQCLEKIDSSNVAARGRVAIVLSDSFLLVGNTQESRRWFSLARESAVESGDHTLVAALTYNRAALNAYLTQLRILSGEASSEAIEIVDSELKSAFGYHRLAQLQSLEQLLHLASVGINIVRGDFEAGWNLAADIQRSYCDVLIPRQRALLSAQMCLCAVRTGRESQDLASMIRGEGISGSVVCDAGDKALIASCCAQIVESLGLFDIQQKYLQDMSSQIDVFKLGLEGLETRLTEFIDLKLLTA